MYESKDLSCKVGGKEPPGSLGRDPVGRKAEFFGNAETAVKMKFI